MSEQVDLAHLARQMAEGRSFIEGEPGSVSVMLGTAYLDLEAVQRRCADLERALQRAGDRLMQVQPAIDIDCAWALDIVPEAQAEIADALGVRS